MSQPQTAAAQGLSSCHTCLKLADASLHHCPRCGSVMHKRKSDSLQRTLTLLITATILYIPANILPIMYTDQLAKTTGSTIMGGVVILIKLGSIPIAAIIFIILEIPLKAFRMPPKMGPPCLNLMFSSAKTVRRFSFMIFILWMPKIKNPLLCANSA